MTGPEKKILIVKLSSLGDVVHALPVAATLRRNHPRAFIAWLVEERYQDLLYNNPDINEVIPARIKYWRKHWNAQSLREIRETLSRLRSLRFDTVLDLQGLIKSGVISWLTGTEDRVGFHRNDCREKLNTLFMTRQVPPMEEGIHVVDRYLNLVQSAMDCSERICEFPLGVPDSIRDNVIRFLKSQPDLAGKPIAGINPGAGFPTKLWDLKKYTALADRMSAELGLSILLTWGPGEEHLVHEIASGMKEPCWIAPPTSIQESVALYQRLALLVSGDSGPLHLCAALDIPTVSIFGPTDPARNGAYGLRHETVVRKLTCSFCWKRACPLGTRECMTLISADEVFEAVKASVLKHVKVFAS